MIKVEKPNLDKLRYLFNDIRFYMGNSVLDGKMGQAYANAINNPTFAMLLVRKYCFISGKINNYQLNQIIYKYNLKEYIIIPDDDIKYLLESEYKNINKFQRYSIKKNTNFDIEKLKKYTYNFNKELNFVRINNKISTRIKEENFINITDDYSNNGIGYCCMYNDIIIGVASSNIFYNNGIEVNIKVKEEYRRKGIATTLASLLILACLEENIKISWDAANLNSVSLAQKLGFEYHSKYDCYKFI